MFRHIHKNAFLYCLVSIVTIIIACSSGGGGGGGGGGNTYSGQLFALSAGTTVRLDAIDKDGTHRAIDSASIPPAGLLSLHAIFGITKHPTKPWLYVTSMNECSLGNDACWGNARIDRFSYAEDTIDHEGLAFNYGAGSGPACADVDWGYTGQVGACAPVTMAFSHDGSRLYVEGSYDSTIQIFSVNSVSGDLTFLWEGTYLKMNHGLAVSPNGNYLYNGESVLQLSGDTASYVSNNWEGSSTAVVRDSSGNNLLTTTLIGQDLRIYDLVDQSAPNQIAAVSPSTPTVVCVNDNPATFHASSDDVSRFIIAGTESVTSVSFDGSTLTLDDQVYDTDDNVDVINRGVAMTGDGKYAVVSWFKPYTDNTCNTALLTGGVTIYGIATDGTLSVRETIDLSVPSRVALAVPVP